MDQENPKNLTQVEQFENRSNGLSLPAAWMHKLQLRMVSIYGHRFQSLFQDEAALADWRDTWARALSGVTGEQIAQGLAKLATGTDGWPPSSGEFRALCVPPRPIPAHQRHPLLDAPKPERKDRHAEIQAMIAMLGNKKPSKQWAIDLKAREESGEKLNYTQQRFWLEALNHV